MVYIQFDKKKNSTKLKIKENQFKIETNKNESLFVFRHFNNVGIMSQCERIMLEYWL